MANITPVIFPVIGQGDADGFQVTWGPMALGDVAIGVGNTVNGVSVPGGGFFAGYADKSIQVEGTFGAGGTVALEGTNDGNTAHYRPLSDPSGTTIAITSSAIKALTEAVIWVRPRITAGDGTTSVTVTVFFRKTQSR